MKRIILSPTAAQAVLLDKKAPFSEESVRNLRVLIRCLMNSVKVAPPNRFSSLAATALELGAMWAGTVLGPLGAVYPYKGEAGPIADDTDAILFEPETAGSASAYWKMLRDQSLPVLLQVKNWLTNTDPVEPFPHFTGVNRFDVQTGLTNVFSCLQEARMWCGMLYGESLRQEAADKQKDAAISEGPHPGLGGGVSESTEGQQLRQQDQDGGSEKATEGKDQEAPGFRSESTDQAGTGLAPLSQDPSEGPQRPDVAPTAPVEETATEGKNDVTSSPVE